MNVEIPDGFGPFLQSRIGGELKSPVQPNPCGHRRDSSARIVRIPSFVSDEQIAGLAREYYAQFSGHFSPIGEMDLCFSFEIEDGNALVISISNFTQWAQPGSENSRILFDVVLQQH